MGMRAVEGHRHYYYRFSWFHLSRPMTLTGTISPVLAGTALAAHRGEVHVHIFIAMLIAALLVQAATNMWNDYFDFKNGQDREKWRTSREQTARPGPSHHAIPFVAGAMMALAAMIGAWLAVQSSYWIIPIGILGLACGYAYSGGVRPLSSIGLGELVGAVFLGIVTPALAYAVQGYALDHRILAVSLPYAWLIATMILANNIRDIEKDRPHRFTLAIALGRANASYLLDVLLAIAYVTVIVLVFFQVIHWISGVVVFASPLACRLSRSYHRGATRRDEIKGMRWAAYHHWVFGLLFAVSLWLSGLF